MIIPGNPDAIDSGVHQMQATAAAMTSAVQTLRNLGNNGSFESQAVTALEKSGSKLSGDLDKVMGLYSDAASALLTYSSVLRHAQAAADGAAQAAGHLDVNGAHYRLQQAQYELHAAQHNPATTHAQLQQLQYDMHHAQSQVDQIAHDASHYQAQIQQARQDVENAAKVAIDAIKSALDDSKLVDSWIDKVKHDVKAVAKVVGRELDKIMPFLEHIQDWLSVVSLVLAFIPGLDVIAAILTAAIVLIDVLEFVDKVSDAVANGGGWGAVLSAGIGVGIDILTSKVGGRFVTHLFGRATSGKALKLVEKGVVKGVRGRVLYAAKLEKAEAKRTLTNVAKSIAEEGKWKTLKQISKVHELKSEIGQVGHSIAMNGPARHALRPTADSKAAGGKAVLIDAIGWEKDQLGNEIDRQPIEPPNKYVIHDVERFVDFSRATMPAAMHTVAVMP